jgi:hypothetical protein
MDEIKFSKKANNYYDSEEDLENRPLNIIIEETCSNASSEVRVSAITKAKPKLHSNILPIKIINIITQCTLLILCSCIFVIAASYNGLELVFKNLMPKNLHLKTNIACIYIIFGLFLSKKVT